MFKNMSRAIRRHHRARLKKARQNYWGYGKFGWRSYCQFETIKMSPQVHGSVVNTPTPCSCYMCGNPRRNTWQSAKECLTMQERRAFEDYKYNIEELIK